MTSLEKLKPVLLQESAAHRQSAGSSTLFPLLYNLLYGGEHVRFKYVGLLENGLDCTTFRARTRAEPAQDIVLKSVDRYGERVYRLLADSGLAPNLFYCGSQQP
jgi:hypothetical protein